MKKVFLTIILSFLIEDTDDNSQKGKDEGSGDSGISPQNGEGFVSATSDRVEGAYYINDTVSMSKSYSSSKEVGYYDITMTDWGTKRLQK